MKNLKIYKIYINVNIFPGPLVSWEVGFAKKISSDADDDRNGSGGGDLLGLDFCENFDINFEFKYSFFKLILQFLANIFSKFQC